VWQKLCLRLNRRGSGDMSAPGGTSTWAGYAAIVIAVHIAVLWIPFYHKAAKIDPERVIGVLLTREEPAIPAVRTVPAPGKGKPGLPSRPVVAKTAPPPGPPAPLQQAAKPSGAAKPVEKNEAPQSGAPGNMADRNTVAPLPSSPIQANDEGVGVAGVVGGRGRTGVGSGGNGTGMGVGGSGSGTGGTGVGGGGNGTGIGGGTGGGEAIRSLAFLHKVEPEYPTTARRRKKEGKVELVVWIDEKGTFLKADVVQATSEMFVKPSIEAAKQSTYVPSTKQGHAKGGVTYNFSLEY
jgi:TonB family protein